jgi:O-antigen/teichoic acid export membrane protein
LAAGVTVVQFAGLLLAASWAAAAFALAVHRRRIGRVGLHLTGAAYGDFARRSFPYMAVLLMATIHMKVGILMIRLLLGPRAVGLYGLASGAAHYASVFLLALSTGLFPAVARSGGRDGRLHGGRALLIIPFGVGVAAAAAIWVAAQPAVLLLLGQRYRESIPALRILAWYMPAVFVSSVALRMMLACGCTAPAFRIVLVNCLANLGANLVLIPKFGIQGAAVAAVLSGGLSAVQCIMQLRQWDSAPEVAEIPEEDEAPD